MKHEHFPTLSALDGILLDTATRIELSASDRRIADSRYRKLKQHLERDGSPLAPYLIDGVSLIYAQGSMGTSTTIVSGTDDDRFDVDAIVEIDMPAHWTEQKAMDVLEVSLQGFPGAVNIVRCTRCIQLQFPSMHMDVTLMDRSARLAIERAGEIMHAPDAGPGERVPSNPWGFTAWFRGRVSLNQEYFAKELRRRRRAISKSRLKVLDEMEGAFAKADQVDLPPMIPSALEAQEAVALKLLKRHLNLKYETSALKRPPSIYPTKRAADIGYNEHGLTAQLIVLADSTAQIMRHHLANGTRPEETNPSYEPDRINDRWPAEGAAGKRDMEMFADTLEAFASKLRGLVNAPLYEIVAAIGELFGERVGAEVKASLREEHDRRRDQAPNQIQPGSGNIRAPAVARSQSDYLPIPRHNFHPLIIRSDDDGS